MQCATLRLVGLVGCCLFWILLLFFVVVFVFCVCPSDDVRVPWGERKEEGASTNGRQRVLVKKIIADDSELAAVRKLISGGFLFDHTSCANTMRKQ